MGKVFLQKSTVNLLSSVLDTPEFFWEQDVPDSCQMLYEKVCKFTPGIELLTGPLFLLDQM